MAKEIVFRGKNAEALKKLSLKEFAELVPSRIKRRFEKGFTEQQKILLKQGKHKNALQGHACSAGHDWQSYKSLFRQRIC